MQSISIYAGDSGELVAAAYTWGLAHPPGYPLYCLLGGSLSHIIPFGTVAWRVGLLSSVPMALSIFVLWLLIKRMTTSSMAASIGSIFYGLLYPVWLYAIVPEVFALFSLFSVLILYVFLRFAETKHIKWFFLLSFLSGMSLTHHHLIVLLLFSIAITTVYMRKRLFGAGTLWNMFSWKQMGLLLFTFILGFSFYLYAPVVSSRYPPFDWEHASSLEGFFRLLFRVSYGTFKASSSTGQSLLDRFFNMHAFFRYVLKDFTSIGVFFSIVGIVSVWRRKAGEMKVFFIYLGFLLFFFFYAGFPTITDFSLGTLERFFIIPYQLLSIFVGIGWYTVFLFVKKYWEKHATQVHIPKRFVLGILIVLFPLFFVRSSLVHYKILIPLRADKTVEKIADDILATVPEGTVLNLSDDISSFAMDHAIYVLKKRPDVIYVRFFLLMRPFYREYLRRTYPSLLVSEETKEKTITEYIGEFIRVNAATRPVMDERTNPFIPEFWVPRGLVSMYYPRVEDVPDRNIIIEQNNSAWKQFQDPSQGVLKTYRHLMLSGALGYYAQKRQTFSQSLFLFKKFPEAEVQMEEAIRLTPTNLEFYIPYVALLIEESKCTKAYESFKTIMMKYERTDELVFIYDALMNSCPEYRQILETYHDEFEKFRRSRQSRIE